MVLNEEKYQLATYYRKRGFSYTEIAKLCGVSKSTVSAWLSKKRFSKDVRKDNAARAAKENSKRVSMLSKARAAETEYKHYKSSPLFIAGLMLYLESGDSKEGTPIRLTSRKMPSHRLFIKFACEYLGVEKEKIKLWLLIPNNADAKVVEKEWLKKVSLPSSQLGKTQHTKQLSQGLHFGTGNTIIGNTVLKKKLIRWIDLASKEL